MNLDVFSPLPRLLSHVGSIRASVERAADEVSSLNATVSRLEPQLDLMAERITLIEERTLAMETLLASVSASLAGVDGALHPFRARGRRRTDPPGHAPGGDPLGDQFSEAG